MIAPEGLDCQVIIADAHIETHNKTGQSTARDAVAVPVNFTLQLHQTQERQPAPTLTLSVAANRVENLSGTAREGC